MGVVIEDLADRRVLDVVGDRITPLVGGDQFGLFEAGGPVGSGPPPHSHDWDEGYVVLDGELAVFVDDEEHLLHAGNAVLIPAGTTHGFQVRAEGTRFLITAGGSGAAGFFADVDANVPHGTPDASSLPLLIEAAKRHGLRSPFFE